MTAITSPGEEAEDPPAKQPAAAGVQEVEAELAALSCQVDSWPQLEGWPPEGNQWPLEYEARRRFRAHAHQRAGAIGTLGALFPVAFEQAEVEFVTAWSKIHTSCCEACAMDADAAPLLQRFFHRVWLVFNFSLKFMQLYFEPAARAHFQTLLDSMGTARMMASKPASDAEDPSGGASGEKPALEEALRAMVAALRQAQRLLPAPDHRTAEGLDALEKQVLSPFPENGSQTEPRFAALPKLEMQRIPLERGLQLMMELRGALAEPDFQHKQRVLKYAPDKCEGLSPGRLGHLCRAYNVLQRYSLAGSAAGLRELATHIDIWARDDLVIRKLLWDVWALLYGQVPDTVPHCKQPVAPGQKVWAFYNTQEQPAGYRYARVDEPPSGSPIVGLTAGWLRGTVLSRPTPNCKVLEGMQTVRVRFDGLFCEPEESKRFQDVAAKENDASWLPGQKWWGRRCCEFRELVVPIGLVRPESDPPPQPLLSVLLLRPWNYWSERRWSDFNVCNDGYLTDVFQGPSSLRDQVPGEYEIHTVFVQSSADVHWEKLNPFSLRGRLKGKNIAAFCLLWPVMNYSTPAGSVTERQFFEYFATLERCGIRGAWPHGPHLYRLMSGKLWIPQMSLNKDFKVPPAVRIHFAEFRRNGRQTALRALEHIMRTRQRVWGKPPMDFEEFRGVVKFGFSWCGWDVMPFKGVDSLVSTIGSMFERQTSEQITCMIQEMIPDVIGEFRILCFQDKQKGQGRCCFHEERLWVAQMQKVKTEVPGFSGMASSSVMPSEVVAQKFFDGDLSVVRAIEDEGSQLVGRWAGWAQTEMPEPLTCVRIDFLVAKTGPGAAEVWTCEVGECGGSLCATDVDGRNASVLNHIIRRDDLGRFPTPLPTPVRRNNGWKSN